MNLSTVLARTKFGLDAPAVRVEVHITAGLPKFNLVGLPEKAVNESRERVRSALINSGFLFPGRRVTVNLAPADMPKEGGGGLDLAISIGILAASKQLKQVDLKDYEFIGELALSGEVLPIRGFIPAAMAVQKAGSTVIISAGNAPEAALLKGIKCLPCSFLYEVVAHLNGTQLLQPLKFGQRLPALAVAANGANYNAGGNANPAASTTNKTKLSPPSLTLKDIRGQQRAKRALIIAAAGRHNLLMNGPPGSGKTMLAKCLPSLLPPLTEEEYMEVLCVHSAAGARAAHSLEAQLRQQTREPPFRAPHHTSTAAALAGGGSNPQPGEISLAHRGVLFLDELPEFSRAVLEVLRQPLEAGRITIARARKHITFPAQFQLIAAMNPCPCGNLTHPTKQCTCSPDRVSAYRAKISAPWLDRIDLAVEVPPTSYEDSFKRTTGVEDQTEERKIKQLIVAARTRQLQRLGKLNSSMSVPELEKYCGVTAKGNQELIRSALEKLGLSLRGVHRTLKLARTLADLENAQEVKRVHLAEALSYRFMN